MSDYENTLTIMPGGGWMVTAYWGNPRTPFITEQIETTPVIAWKVACGPDGVIADPVWEDQADGKGTVVFPGGRDNYVVWHPGSASGAVATVEAAEAVLKSEHPGSAAAAS